MVEPKRKTVDVSETYLTRLVPAWGSPIWMDGNRWRAVVNRQMLGGICRTHLIMQVLQFRWEIRARDPQDTQKLKKQIEHYTRLFIQGDDEGYDILVDRLLQDVLDIPFGGALELVYDGEELFKICNIDGATLRPTANSNYPVIQQVVGYGMKPIELPAENVVRMYLSPRTSIKRRGWGMAPPELIYLAMILLSRGDRYFANLLLDTPPAGILDVADMARDAAVIWVNSFRELFLGSESFKIPVLYEHEKPAKFIPFSKSPADLAFTENTLHYASVVCAGYGMLLSDLALAEAQRSLAGSIREERHSRRLSVGLLVTKLKYMFERILPPELEWRPIFDDEETMVALGRARATTARALREMVDALMITPELALQQMMADGLITLAIPDTSKVSSSELKISPPTERPTAVDLVGNPVAPSSGGHGEIKPTQ